MKPGSAIRWVWCLSLFGMVSMLCASRPSPPVASAPIVHAVFEAVSPTPLAVVLAASTTQTRTTTPDVTVTSTARATATPTARPTMALPVRTPTPYVAPLATPIRRGQAEGGTVALTLDAGGREPGRTAEVLDLLRKHGIRATIFLTGQWSEANPALVGRMIDEGHELANHTYDHPHLRETSDAEILAQVGRTEEVVRKVAGVGIYRDVRPPYGETDGRVGNLLLRNGYRVVLWSVDSGDWRAEVPVSDIVKRVGQYVVAGDVVVFHVYAAKAAEALPAVLEAWQARGLRPATLGEVVGR